MHITEIIVMFGKYPNLTTPPLRMPPIIKILRDHRFDRISRKGLTARQYDPTIARFTSPDPLNGNYSHLSPYLYCAANPINLSDPSGLAVIYDYNGDFLGHLRGFHRTNLHRLLNR